MSFDRFSTMNKITFFLLLVISNSVIAQVVWYNGVHTTITTGGVLFINDGHFQNQDTTTNMGELIVDSTYQNNHVTEGDGIYKVRYNWENNDEFNSGTSRVELDGGNDQYITGTSMSNFYNLWLRGTGVKYLDLDASVSNELDLDTLELNTDSSTFFVYNPSNTAIKRVIGTNKQGFVASANTGWLSWAVNSASNYFFPTGSRISGSSDLFRPFEITPSTASADTFRVRLAPVNATDENYPLVNKDSSLCTLNPAYYHQVWRDSTVATPVTLKAYFDRTADIPVSTIAQWTNNNEWSDIKNTVVAYNTLSSINSLSDISKTGHIRFNKIPFVLASPTVEANITITDSMICFEDVARLCADYGGGVGPYSFLWTPSNETDSCIDVSSSGMVYLEVTDISGCKGIDSVDIQPQAQFSNINAFPEDTTILEGASFQARVTGSSDYIWTPSDYHIDDPSSATPVLDPRVDTVYVVCSIDNLGCSSCDTVSVTVMPNLDIWVPNIFSPNGDGNNDIVSVRSGMDICGTVNFIIYDRWGEIVFETDGCGEANGWDGTFNGEKVNANVFVYVVTATVNGQSVVKNGNITVVNN